MITIAQRYLHNNLIHRHRHNIRRTMTTSQHHKQQIFDLLDTTGIKYRSIQHEETPTSEDSARRVANLSTGGKALVLKFRVATTQEENSIIDADSYAIFVMSASRKLHTKLIRREFNSKNVRFATPEELSQLTNGLVPGSVPPFGRHIVDLDLFVDSSIVENEKIAFNCGSLTDSIVMDRADYMNVAAPNKVFAFSK